MDRTHAFTFLSAVQHTYDLLIHVGSALHLHQDVLQENATSQGTTALALGTGSSPRRLPGMGGFYFVNPPPPGVLNSRCSVRETLPAEEGFLLGRSPWTGLSSPGGREQQQRPTTSRPASRHRNWR